ncbi:protein-disulfide isomerase [Rhodovulum iodosum]|uniref:Protein-disulfide isomerase n=1 Tax=Rhodovulum iodosum TaxID=68291 RepID=A0ABV3XXU4_9RHOB|nr:DsbA family protein [Rhodovulum robiginosum]RSK38162.1 DsbA family protein [Rhodovulum robiginosum]
MRRALALSLALAGAPAGAVDLTALTGPERAAFRAELRAYLLDHPEVIEEALSAGAGERRRYEEKVTDDLALLESNAEALFDAKGDWTGGNAEGDMPLTAFVGYGCTTCAAAMSGLDALTAEDPGLKVIVKDIGPEGDDAAARFAQAVLSLAGPDAYRRAQAALFDAPAHDAAHLAGIAERLGLDPSALGARMDAPETRAKIARTRALADRLDLGPPPAYVLPRTMVRGDVPPVALSRIIAAMRAKR